jgi:hypothetical protein
VPLANLTRLADPGSLFGDCVFVNVLVHACVSARCESIVNDQSNTVHTAQTSTV